MAEEGVAPRLRLGMVGGGAGSFIGEVHRIAARLDDRFELVAGVLSTDPERARASARAARIPPERAYADFAAMAEAEAARPDGAEVVSVVTPNSTHHAACRAFLDRGIDVICDKPLTTTLDDALDLVETARRTGRMLGVTYNYTGYPMVRHARALVEEGALGTVRVVQGEFALGWLATALEREGSKQAEWRTDPARSGPSGVVADIGTHTVHLAEFVTGLRVEAVAADLATLVAGRRLEDNAGILLRFGGGARGMLWASMVAAGETAGLRLRVYGETGSLAWDQAFPDQLHHRLPTGEIRTYQRGGRLGPAARRATRTVAGLPEGYLEGFANLYRDYAEILTARREGRAPDPLALWAPMVEDGARGVKFVEAVLESHRADGRWVEAGLDL